MPTWLQLAKLSDDELRQQDIAAQNLACPVGLPGWDGTEIPRLIRRIDEMAESIGKVTRQLLPRYRQAGYQSEARWRVSLMVTMLWRDYGVRYNRDKIPLEVPLEVADTFLHGIFMGDGGTCASLPVLYTAVGRRLGYPIKLVETLDIRRKVGHRFCRWDGVDGERFNIDGYESKAAIPPDDYYRTEYALPPEIERAGKLMQSKTPQEELACFLKDRALYWNDLGNIPKSAQAYIHAYSLVPDNLIYRDNLGSTLNRWMDDHDARKPPNFPPVLVTVPCRLFPKIELKLEQDYLALQAIELALNNELWQRKWWELMRGRVPGYQYPTRMRVHWQPNGSCNINFEVGHDGCHRVLRSLRSLTDR